MAALAGSIARRYARALFAIGVDQRNFEALGSELEARLLLDALGFLLGSCQQAGFFALPF